MLLGRRIRAAAIAITAATAATATTPATTTATVTPFTAVVATVPATITAIATTAAILHGLAEGRRTQRLRARAGSLFLKLAMAGDEHDLTAGGGTDKIENQVLQRRLLVGKEYLYALELPAMLHLAQSAAFEGDLDADLFLLGKPGKLLEDVDLIARRKTVHGTPRSRNLRPVNDVQTAGAGPGEPRLHDIE